MEPPPHACTVRGTDFAPDRSAAERRTRIVAVFAAVMMAAEIAGGWRFHSMALLADGWHMGTHLAAFVIAALAYSAARRLRHDESFSFGTGKIEVLGGYTSAIILGVIALGMAVESAERLYRPLAVDYGVSIAIAAVGLAVNVVSALVLSHGGHDHDHGHDHHHDHAHEDLNLKAAYVHVVADAVTSLLAIGALTAGRYLGWIRLDPLVGLIGSVVVGQWAFGLIRKAGAILLDRTPPNDLLAEIRAAVESSGGSIADLHVWPLGTNRYSAIVSIVAEDPLPPERYRELLAEHEELRHVTIEVNPTGRRLETAGKAP